MDGGSTEEEVSSQTTVVNRIWDYHQRTDFKVGWSLGGSRGGRGRRRENCTRIQFRELAIYPILLSLSDESNSSAHCWDVLKVSTVFLSSLQVSPLLLFSAPILAGK